MNVERKSVGMLIDELCTTSMKLFYLQEVEKRQGVTDSERGELFRKIQTLNVRRNALINAIDKIVDENTFSTSEKTYK